MTLKVESYLREQDSVLSLIWDGKENIELMAWIDCWEPGAWSVVVTDGNAIKQGEQFRQEDSRHSEEDKKFSYT